MDGRPRPAGGLFDIGAFEFGALTGDYNRDGTVNGGDYVIWRKLLGAAGTRYFGADGSGNGIFDQADYDLWRANIDAAPAATGMGANTIPESSAIAMLLFVLVTLPIGSRLSR